MRAPLTDGNERVLGVELAARCARPAPGPSRGDKPQTPTKSRKRNDGGPVSIATRSLSAPVSVRHAK